MFRYMCISILALCSLGKKLLIIVFENMNFALFSHVFLSPKLLYYKANLFLSVVKNKQHCGAPI